MDDTVFIVTITDLTRFSTVSYTHLEDVIAWRVETLRHLLMHHGKSAVEIDRTLAIAMEEFIEWRHKICLLYTSSK